jgi:hypothetical protein
MGEVSTFEPGTTSRRSLWEVTAPRRGATIDGSCLCSIALTSAAPLGIALSDTAVYWGEFDSVAMTSSVM